MISEQNLNRFTTEKEFDDPNMVTLVGEYLKNEISVNAAEYFLKDPLIVNILNAHSSVQRVIINRWFSTILLIFRANNDVCINDTIVLLINDGYVEDWFTIFNLYIIPFIKKNNVLI